MLVRDMLLDRRSIVAGAALIGGSAATGSAMRNLLIRRRETVNVDGRGASLAGLRAATRELRLYDGGTIRLRTPTIAISAADLAAAGSIEMGSDTIIDGNDCTVRLTGAALAPPLFSGRDVSHVAIRHLVAIGNGRAIADTRTGTFALFLGSANGTQDVEDIALDEVTLAGFAGERWVQFLHRNQLGRRMAGLSIVHLRVSDGGSIDPGAIGVSAAALWVHGVEGAIEDVNVRRLTVDGPNIKQGVALVHQVRNATIEAADIRDVGKRGATDDAGAYAIMAYADRGEMRDISIIAPIIRRPRSAGIYLRGAYDVRVIDATIDGQSDADTADLPKGAIAINGCSRITIDGGQLTGNRFDLSVADGGVNDLSLAVERLKTNGSETSVMLAISPGRGAIGGVRLIDCNLSGKSRVLRVMNEQVPGRHYDHVEIRGGVMSSPTAANVIELTQGSPTYASEYTIADVTVRCNHVGIMCAGFQGSLSIRNTMIQSLGQLDYGIVADDCPRIDWDGIAFNEMHSGYAYAARQKRRAVGGTLRNITFPATTVRGAPGSLQPR